MLDNLSNNYCLISAPEKFQVSSMGFIVALICSCERNDEWKKCLWSVVVPFTGTHEPNKLTCSHLSGFIAQLVRAPHRHCRGHGFESCWRHLKFFRCTYGTIAEIVQQVWGSFLQLISQPHFPNISFTQGRKSFRDKQEYGNQDICYHIWGDRIDMSAFSIGFEVDIGYNCEVDVAEASVSSILLRLRI